MNKRYPGKKDMQVYHLHERHVRIEGVTNITLERMIDCMPRGLRIIGRTPQNVGEKFIIQYGVHGAVRSDIVKKLQHAAGSTSLRVVWEESSRGRETRPDLCPKNHCAPCELALKDMAQGKHPQRRYRVPV